MPAPGERKRAVWPRLARLPVAGALLASGAAACDSVLDIEDPKLRPTTGGDSTQGGNTPEGGEGGAPTLGGAMNTQPLAGTSPGGEGGAAGSPTPPECMDTEVQCGGTMAKTPQICQDGRWVTNTDEAPGDCAVLCDAGKCLECEGDERRCAACNEDDATCSTNQPQQCVKGHWKNDGPECAQFCQDGQCETAPSCAATWVTRTTCGAESCCRSLHVPGGSFKRNYDGDQYKNDAFAAEVSEYYLDKYEVTVGRMRQFVEAFPEFKKSMKPGDGKSKHIPDDKGWNGDFELPTDRDALLAELACDDATWSDDVQDPHDDLPINCVSFYVSYAFCIWDGGRLPSDLEWNFAASGGAEQRAYPWEMPTSGPPISTDYANYDDGGGGVLALIDVGSKPKGAARWGQLDMAGNVWERALDYFGDDPATCKDCLNTTPSLDRVLRGGAYNSGFGGSKSAFRSSYDPASTRSNIGFRCARDVQ